MDRDLLLALLNAPLIDAFAFDDDDTDDGDGNDDDEGDDDGDDAETDDKGKEKAKEEKKPDVNARSLKRQLSEAQKRLTDAQKRLARVSKQNRNLRLRAKGETPNDEKGGESVAEAEDDVATLRNEMKTLSDRLDERDAELHIEREVKRKLQPLITGGLNEEEAEDRMAAALELRVEDFMDDDGAFDPEAFLEKYPFLRSEGETPAPRDRLLGGSGKKTKSKKDWVGDRLTKMREAEAAKRNTRTERIKR